MFSLNCTAEQLKSNKPIFDRGKSMVFFFNLNYVKIGEYHQF